MGRPAAERAVRSGSMLFPLLGLLPGLGLVVPGVAVALLLGWLVPTVGPLVWAVGLGVLIHNLPGVRAHSGTRWPDPERTRPGLRFAAKQLLRVGVALLGFRLVLGDVLDLGPAVLLVIAVTVFATFFATLWLGRVLRVRSGTTMLLAAGFSICGASAIAATGAVSDAEDEDVAAAIAAVTIFGTIGIVAMPALGTALGLSTDTYGVWVGAGSPEVAQVVAGASAVSGALTVAIAVKLARVLLLVPMVALVGARRRTVPGAARPPIMPLFVVGFVVACVIRSTGVLPAGLLEVIELASTVLLAAALFGLGAGVKLTTVWSAGARPQLLGLASWAVALAVPLLCLQLT